MEADLGVKDKKEMVGYRQQPGKLDFTRPGSGGSSPISEREGRREYRKVKVANYPSHGAHIGMMTS
jgi:hypothetical protein